MAVACSDADLDLSLCPSSIQSFYRNQDSSLLRVIRNEDGSITVANSIGLGHIWVYDANIKRWTRK